MLIRAKSSDEIDEEERLAEENKKKIHPIFRDRINCAFIATNSYQQNFFRNTGILKSLIKILEWDLIYHQYLSVSITKKLLTNIYEILGYCCQKNPENKKFLMKYLEEPFLMHFHSDVEVGASAFMNHLISQNTFLLKNKTEVNKIIDEFFKRLENVQKSSPLRAFILKMMGNIVQNQEKNLRTIQNMVLSRLFENKELNFNFEVNPVYLANWSEAIWKSDPIVLHKGIEGVIIPSELCFLLSFLDLLTVCSGGLNSFSENISQNMVTLDDIAEIFKCKNLHPLIRTNVIFFFFEVYLETERENYFHFQQILTKILRLMVDDFIKFLDEPIEPALQDIVVVTHDQCETNKYYHEECILRMMDCFDNIIKKNIQVNSAYFFVNNF